MKKPKHRLSHKQFQINCTAEKQTRNADKWIRTMGMSADRFRSIHIKLLQAQRQAHTIIKEHSDLINPQQLQSLQNFAKRMRNNKSHQTVKPEAATTTLNISSKVNRQLFRQRRQHKQAAPQTSSTTIKQPQRNCR
jgi:hypothetical protein